MDEYYNPSENHAEDLSDLATNSTYRTLNILKALAYHKEATLEELAPFVDLSRPTLFRFLVVLQRMGYVAKNKDNRYSLTPMLFAIASRSIEDVELNRIAKPFLEDMCFDTGETSLLGILNDDAVLYLTKVESKYNVRFHERLGKMTPLYCTALGKVLLAGMSDEELYDYLAKEKLIPYTNNTIVDPIKLKEHIKLTRERGYSEVLSEYEQDIHALGCPVFDHDGKVIAAVSINWPLFRETPDKFETCLARLKSVARTISILMGYNE